MRSSAVRDVRCTGSSSTSLSSIDLVLEKDLWRIRARCPETNYTLQHGSRSEFFLVQASRISATQYFELEMLRRDVFQQLSDEVVEKIFVLPSAAGGGGRPSCILSNHDKFELPARWAVQHPAEVEHFSVARTHVTVADAGREVVVKTSGQRGRVCEVSSMNAGQYWVRYTTLTPSTSTDEAAPAVVAVEREALALAQPLDLLPDPLIPCDEATLRGTSGCIALTSTLALKKLCVGPLTMTQAEQAAITDEITFKVAQAARAARKVVADEYSRLLLLPQSLASAAAGATQSLPRILLGSLADDDSRDVAIVSVPSNAGRSGGVTTTVDNSQLHVLERTILKLAHLYREKSDSGSSRWCMPQGEGGDKNNSDAALLHTACHDEVFCARVASMLLRYSTLFGPHGRNQGPQAAIPPQVVKSLHETFNTTAECFASPLNAQLGSFCSLFPDTDLYFGSLGSFFDVDFLSGSYEVNPPFDTKLLWAMHAHLDKMLTAAVAAAVKRDRVDKDDHEVFLDVANQSLTFVIIVPSHLEAVEKDRKRGRGDAAATPLAAMLASPFCRGSLKCAADKTCFVDGHQHILRNPYFTIATDTHLLVLSTAAFSAEAGLETIRTKWYSIMADRTNSS